MDAEARARRVELLISSLLKWGVRTSLALLVAGIVLCFVRADGYARTAEETRRLVGVGGSFPRSAHWLFTGLMHGDGRAVAVLGLLTLMATPVLRVAVSAIAFGVGRDRVYVVVTLGVLAMLVLSFFLGSAG